MAKKQYESKIAQQTAQFTKSEDQKTVVSASEQVKEEEKSVLPVPVYNEERHTNSEPEGIQTTLQTQNQISKADRLHRQTFYMTFEEMAALEKFCMEENIGKSDVIRQVLDAGLESLSPGIFDRTKQRAEELRASESRQEKKGNNRAVYNKLKGIF